ncbi:MAG: transporter substrate-binding domain-containing protein, partial [Gammaproteobacteria bacterium]|nr:transporter substrate-binding domain-containing protein [Gammaproteobacteria bacterium]
MKFTTTGLFLVLFFLGAVTAPPMVLAENIDNQNKDTSGDTNTLTQVERAFIEAHPVIQVSNMVSYAPISFVGDDGEASGFAVDYIKLVAEKTGLNLEFTSDSFANLLEMSKQKKVDILSVSNKTPARESFLAFPQPFL